MANEAVMLEYPRWITNVTVADGATIEKGTLLALSDPNTGAASSSTDVFGGITMAEKVASDGATRVAVALDGVWDIKCTDTTVTVGSNVSISGANLVRLSVEADYPLGKVVGKVTETATSGETVRVWVGHF